MIKHCAYCNKAFEALRKDKCFCCHSCRQMAFVKRKEESDDFLFSTRQNVNQSVNIKRQKIDASLDTSQSEQIKNLSKRIETSDEIDASIDVSALRKSNAPEETYQKVYCYWLDYFQWDIEIRGHRASFTRILSTYGIKALQVSFVSEHYLCMVRCILYLNEQRKVLWEDLAEITNALIFLCQKEEFKDLPSSYPYTKEILQLRDKLKSLGLDTEGENEITFALSFQTKYQLLLQQYELSVFRKITFNQLLLSFEK